MTKYIKYTLKGFGYFLAFILLVYIGIYIYVSVNKKSLLNQVNTEAGKRLNGDVKIGDVELSFFRHFPKVSVLLHKVSIRDTMYSKHKHTFFEADELYLNVGFWKLIRKQSSLTGLTIKKGTLYLFTDSTGYTNEYLLNLKKDTATKSSSTAGNNEFKLMELEDVRIVMENSPKDKLFDFQVNELKADINDKNTSLDVRVKQNILVNSLAFNLPKGSFVKNKVVEGKFDLRFDKQNKQMQFDSIDLKIGKHPFNLTGRFDLASMNNKVPQFSLVVHTKKIGYEFAKSILTTKISTALSFASLSNVVDVTAKLIGPYKGGDPLINVFWSTSESNIKSPLIELDNCKFTGTYTNEVIAGLPRKDPNSKIELKNFSGEWQGLPITSENMVVNDLAAPNLVCDLQSKFPLSTLNDFLNSSSVSLTSGNAVADLTYNGPLQKNTTSNSFLNGYITIKDGLLNYNPRDIALKNVNGRIVFKNSDVFVEKLQCQVLNNNIVMDGTAKNILTLVSTQVNKVVVDWNIYSPSLNMTAFTSLLKQRKKVASKRKSANKLQNAAQKLDDVLEKGSINVNLRADKLVFKKFEATNVVAYVNVLENSWIIQKVNLNHAGGTMNITGDLVNKNPNYHDGKANITLTNVDVSKVFSSFSNFGQDGITSESIKGKLTSAVKVEFGLDDNGQVFPPSVIGQVNFSLKNGALINYEPVKKLQTFLFKKRDFENIEFAELKNVLEIENQEVKINRMEIQSSVLSMFVEGIFSMKKTTDISIQIPLSNLKKRDKDYKPQNEGLEKKGGMSVFIRGTPGADGNVKFKYDLLHRFRN